MWSKTSRVGNVETVAPHPHPLDPAAVSAARAGVGSPDESGALVELFRLLGDPVRARIALALGAGGELCVGDIALATETRENAVSYALRHLRAAGLVERRRAGRVIYYRLTDTRLHDLIARARKIADG